jgi:hypothetical protein
MSPRELVLQQALALPPGDQAFVAQSLEEHLASQVPPQIDEEDGLSGAAFLAELHRRSEGYRTGAIPSREWTEVLRELEIRQVHETES